jgi:hypothetical protein
MEFAVSKQSLHLTLFEGNVHELSRLSFGGGY